MAGSRIPFSTSFLAGHVHRAALCMFSTWWNFVVVQAQYAIAPPVKPFGWL